MSQIYPRFEALDNGKGYRLLKEIEYLSPRYEKWVTVPEGYVSDGASGPAVDIVGRSWWVHDILCDTLKFDDGSPCSNWKASMILHDILKSEGRWFRARTWFLATLIGANLGKRIKRLFS